MGKARKTKINKIIQEKIGSVHSKDDLPGSYTKAMSELAIKAPGIWRDLDYSNQLGDGFEIPHQKLRSNRLRLDLRKFGSQLSRSLMKSYTGHCIGICRQGMFQYSWTKGYARDLSVRWQVETNMHIASLSKFLTALGMIRCMELNGKVFDISGNNITNGAPVILYPWHGGYNQQFEIIPQENGLSSSKHVIAARCWNWQMVLVKGN